MTQLDPSQDQPPADHELAGGHEQAEDIQAEVWRGQLLDRELARELGQAEPSRATTAGGYLDALERRPLLPPATERDLVVAANAGDRAARGQLVEAFMPLIGSVARTYRSVHVQRLELLQEGVVGLLRALEGFDPDRGVPFWGYAAWWVRQAMQQLVAELTRPVVLSDRACATWRGSGTRSTMRGSTPARNPAGPSWPSGRA